MNQDRIGAFLLLIAASWMVLLAFTHPGNTASGNFRYLVLVVAFGLLVLTILPQFNFQTSTALTFSVLGVCLHIGTFGILGIGLKGLLPAAMVVVAMWFRRDRFSGDAVVVVSVVACCLAIVQANVVIFAWMVIALANLFIWMWKRAKRPWTGPQPTT